MSYATIDLAVLRRDNAWV